MPAARVQVVDAELPKPGESIGVIPLRAVREVEAGAEEVVAVARDLGHDLAEAERHDREVVAAQPQRRQADQDADERGQEPGRDEQEPDRDVDAGAFEPTPTRAEVDVRASANCSDANHAAVYAPIA